MIYCAPTELAFRFIPIMIEFSGYGLRIAHDSPISYFDQSWSFYLAPFANRVDIKRQVFFFVKGCQDVNIV